MKKVSFVTAVVGVVLLLALIEGSVFVGIALGVAWLIGKIFEISVNYGIVGVVASGLYLLKLITHLMVFIPAKMAASKIEKDYGNWKNKNGWR